MREVIEIEVRLTDGSSIPLVANAMTHPDYQRMKCISALVQSSIHTLSALGFKHAFFAIHPNNERSCAGQNVH